MSSRHGKLRQRFKMRIDLDGLIDEIVSGVINAIESDSEIDSAEADEWYCEYNELVLHGSYDADFISFYSPATRYDPPEYDIERPYLSSADDSWLFQSLSENIRKHLKVIDIEEDDKNVDDLGVDEW